MLNRNDMGGATRRAACSGLWSKGAAALLLAAALAGCASTKDDVVGGADAARAAAAAASSRVNQNSIEYFKVAVGDRVYFGTDRSDLTPEAKAVLQRQAEWLQQNSSVQVRVEGHADERGTREYNLALGARRAETVMNYLASLGVAPRRMQAVSYGRERPVESCSQDRCWAKNRRAVTAPM